jgi:hypothetical protein
MKYAYCIQTFFIRTEPVGWSLKSMILFWVGQMTVEWAMDIAGTSSKMT